METAQAETNKTKETQEKAEGTGYK